MSAKLEEAVRKAMADKGVSIRDLSEALDLTYEHSRRIVNGFPPSRPVLRALCKFLDLDFDEMDELCIEASIRRKFGTAVLRMAGRNPELEQIEEAWSKLTPDQKRDATAMIQGWASRAK